MRGMLFCKTCPFFALFLFFVFVPKGVGRPRWSTKNIEAVRVGLFDLILITMIKIDFICMGVDSTWRKQLPRC